VKPEEEEICRRTTPSGGSITSFGIFVSPLWLPTAGTAEGQKHYKQPYVHRPMSYNQSEMPSAAFARPIGGSMAANKRNLKSIQQGTTL
jgi:hypothetical protein